jgi:RNA polymerase sigma-70 factor (ECF subfamily)
MDRINEFNNFRSLLFSIAYRMLGSAMDAEDMVQEAFLRWQQTPIAEIQSTKAYLTTIITRLCIDHLERAYVQRESYVGTWLPEPIPTSAESNESIILRESLSIAFLTLLETLTPPERACFLLREVFDYDYAEISAIIGKSELNCRQMVSRAKAHLAERRPRYDVTPDQQTLLLGQFLQSCLDGDLDGLLTILEADIISWSDGGGKRSAALNPVYGADNVARLSLGVARRVPPAADLRILDLNGQPALVVYSNGQPYNALLLDIANGRVRGLYNILNPDKLGHIPPLESA